MESKLKIHSVNCGIQYLRSDSAHQSTIVFENGFRVASNHRTGITASVRDVIVKTFLPSGYPDTVKTEYMEYQIYDSIQALCSYLRGILCTHALLISAGVGSENASALAAAITWVTRDGIGMMSSILFSTLFSVSFGIYVKEWRLFADVINDVAHVLDMISPLCPRCTHIYILSLSAIFKTMCGISAGATKLCVTNHLCLSNNAADLNAKEGSQETAVSLAGLVLGIALARAIGTEGAHTMIVFALLTIVHVYANYHAVSCLHLETINPPRCWLLVQEAASCIEYMLSQSDTADLSAEQITAQDVLKAYVKSNSDLSIARINSKESIWATLQIALLKKHDIRLGCSLLNSLSNWPGYGKTSLPRIDIEAHLNAFDGYKYCIFPRRSGGYSVLLKGGVTQVDELRAYSQCVYMALRRRENSEKSAGGDYSLLNEMNTLEYFWKVFAVLLDREGWRYELPGCVLLDPEEWLCSSGTWGDSRVEFETTSGTVNACNKCGRHIELKDSCPHT